MCWNLPKPALFEDFIFPILTSNLVLFLPPCPTGVPFEPGQEWPRREWRSEINPPRPCASRHVEALNQHQTLQTSKTSNKPTRGRVYPPPSPSQTVRLAQLQTFFNGGVAPSEGKIRGKNVYLLLMGPTRPVHMHIIRPKWPPTPPYFMKKPTFLQKNQMSL